MHLSASTADVQLRLNIEDQDLMSSAIWYLERLSITLGLVKFSFSVSHNEV